MGTGLPFLTGVSAEWCFRLMRRYVPRLAGEVAIVTGGGGGLGRAQCIRLAEEGAAVAVWDIDRNNGTGTATAIPKRMLEDDIDSIGVRFDEVDATNEDQVATTMKSIADQFGGIDIMVNNHGHFIFKSIEETTGDDWDTIMAVNIKGTAFTCKHVAPYMRSRGGGSIINFGSICGVRAHHAFTPYN